MNTAYKIQPHATVFLTLCLAVVFVWRFSEAILSFSTDPYLMQIFAFSVIFPALCVTFLLVPGNIQSIEGVYMRIGTIIHMLLIILVKPFALALLLGLPVVFLVVEWVTTKLPISLYMASNQFFVLRVNDDA